MKKVFIIDDDKFLLDMYALKFKESGFDVEVAVNAYEALEKLGHGYAPDVILLDVIMPGMDGLEFMKQAREKDLIRRSTVVILSNLGQKEDVEKGLQVGAKDYIVKASCTPSEVVQ